MVRAVATCDSRSEDARFAVLYILEVILNAPRYLASPPGYAVRLARIDNGAILDALGSTAVSTTAFSQIFATILIGRIVL